MAEKRHASHSEGPSKKAQKLVNSGKKTEHLNHSKSASFHHEQTHPTKVLGWHNNFSENLVEMSHIKEQFPTTVAFFPVGDVSTTFKLTHQVGQLTNLVDLMGTLKVWCPDFSIVDLSDKWRKGFRLAEQLRASEFRAMNAAGPFVSCTTKTINFEDKDEEILYSKACYFLTKNSSKGPSKEFLCDLLVPFIKGNQQLQTLECLSPNPTSLSVSQYSCQDDYMPKQPDSDSFDSSDSPPLEPPETSAAKTSPTKDTQKRRSVPDVIVYDMFYPKFALTIEVKRPKEMDDSGAIQLFTQMLTQMHHVDVHFGIMLSTMQWKLIIAKKNLNEIDVRQYGEQMQRQLPPDQTKNNDRRFTTSFDVNAFENLLKWMSSILVHYCAVERKR